MGKHKNAFLGKKRQTNKRDDQELDKLNKLKKEKKDEDEEIDSYEEEEIEAGDSENEDYSGSDSESESSEQSNDDEKPKKSLFGDSIFGKTPSTGLFGNLGGDNKKSDFKLFTPGQSLFTNSNLFNPGSSLFSTSTKGENSTTTNTAVFGSKQPDLKEELEDDNESEEDQLQRSDSPNPYNPLKDDTKSKDKGPYKKTFVKQIENLLVYNQNETKYTSKGNGFLSFEYAEVEGKKIGVLVFRNSLGNKIIEGFFSPKLKLIRTVKKLNHFATFSFFVKGEKGKFEVRTSKIPFSKEEDLKEFEKAFNEVIDLITPTKEEAKEEK